MEFIPAGERIGSEHKVRSFELKDAPGLPDGNYSLVDYHCADSDCDCRKTMIHVIHNNAVVSIINFGWASSEYYKKWMYGDINKRLSTDELQFIQEMKGLSVDINSPDLIDRSAILSLLQQLMDDNFVEVIQTNYLKFKAAI